MTNDEIISLVLNAFNPISAIHTDGAAADTDTVLFVVPDSNNNLVGGKMPASVLRAYLTKALNPTINSSGYWVIGSTVTSIKAEGVTPLIRRGTNGIEASTDKGATYNTVALWSDLRPDFAGMSAEEKAAFKFNYSDFTAEEIAALQKPATDAAAEIQNNYATAEANRNTVYQTAESARGSSYQTAESARGTSYQTAETNRDTQFASKEQARDNAANTAVSNVNNALALLTLQGNSVWVFMVRKHGNADPAAYKWYGQQSNIKVIGEHARMGWFKNKNQYTVCAKGRISQDVNGNAIAMDGSQGDLLMFFDVPMYHYENTVTDATDGELDIIGVGLTPSILFGKESSKMPPFGFFPDRSVLAKIGSDTAVCLHSVYSPSVAGTYKTPSAMFKQVHVTDGGGKASQYISTMESIAHSQAKNADGIHGDGWYGLYYICYQIWMEMMFIEGGSVNHTLIDTGFGVGCTMADTVDANTFYGDTIYGNSGVKTILSDGTVKGYAGLMSQPWKASAAGSVIYAADAIDGGAHYGFIKLLEALRVSDAIVKNGWEGKLGVASNIFYFDDNNNLQLSSDGSINLSTGTGMTPNKMYYVARNVTGYAGLSDGVLTCVINAYMKMSFIDAACYSDGTSLVDGCAIYKFSMPLFRGVTWFNGTFTQLQGFHYMIHTDANGVKTNNAIYQPDYTALPSITNNNNSNCYGLETDTLQMEKGMLKTENIQFGDGWASKCNPAISLFYYPNLGGDRRTYENAYVWRSGCWGSGVNGAPEKGYKCVNASVVGCACYNSDASVRSVYGVNSAVYGNDDFCGGSALIGINI